jgi:uncharacterized membrane protein
MGGGAGFLIVVALLVILGGSICGIVALSRIQRLARDLENVRNQVRSLWDDLGKQQRQAPVAEGKAEVPPQAAPEEVHESLDLAPALEEAEAPQPSFSEAEEEPPVPPPPLSPPLSARPSPGISRQSLEMTLGTRWLNWVGMVMLLVGVGFFLKYAYDNAWIGPKGRLAIGAILGIIAVGLGERFRRRDWSVLFQVLTGGGLAIFYLCVFFSFQVYHLSGQTVSMVLAVLVTALSVAMAVAHDAASIAVLAVIGGFLSPVLLSTGTNHPYALFSYIAILDSVAMGAAYFRRWRALDVLCFGGTIVMYLGWHQKFYGPDQMVPALVFTSLFYLMFLLIPTLHSLVRRLPETTEGMAIVVFSALLSFASYYSMLFPGYRQAMGFIVMGQALLVFLLYQVWAGRAGRDSTQSAGLLTITLGLVIIAIPIQLKFYGLPIAWAMEGLVLLLLGIRFRIPLPKAAGMVALFLAAGGLISRLPLHGAPFVPVLNIPFGSWSFVAAMAAAAAYALRKDKEGRAKEDDALGGAAFLLALSLACFLLSAELSQFWTLNHPFPYHRTYESGSLVILWSLIAAVIAVVTVRRGATAWMPLPWACYGVGACIYFAGLQYPPFPSKWLALNASFLPGLVFILSLWWGARLCRRLGLKTPEAVQELAGHGFLALVLALECWRWGHHGGIITAKMGFSLISAAWAAQAFAVMWIGLAQRSPVLRYLGFGLFLLSVGKTLIVDLSEVEKVYRIVSFAVSGFLLVAAGYFYQRYSSRIQERPNPEKEI